MKLRAHPSFLKLIVPFAIAAASLTPSFRAQPQVATNWPGIDEAHDQVTISTPPDPNGAAGPYGIIQTVNTEIVYWDKHGNKLWNEIELDQFYGSIPIVPYDTKAIFDPASGRFFVASTWSGNGTPQHSYCYVAVSRNNNPQSSSSADWYTYTFETTESNASGVYYSDYTCLGADNSALYVTYNMRDKNGDTHNCLILALNKSDLINNVPQNPTPIFTHPNGIGSCFTLQPVTPIGGSPGNVAFFAETPALISTIVRIWAVNNPINGPTLVVPAATINVPDNGGAIENAPQEGTTTYFLDTLSPLTQGNAFWYNGSVWFCNTAGGASGYSKIYYYKVNLNGYPNGTPTLGESGVIDGGPNIWNYQPAIGANSMGDMCMVFCQSSAASYPSIFYTFRSAYASGFPAPKLLQSSTTYDTYFNNPCRWGDFARVAGDPNDNSFWITHELMNDTVTHVAWSTVWGNIFIPGTIETAFNPASALNGTVNTLLNVPNGNGSVVIGGAFTAYGSTTRNHLAEINADGSLDAGFSDPGINGYVYAMAVQNDGNIVIGGDFTSVGGYPYTRVARITPSGQLDLTFSPGNGANGVVEAVVIQPDGKIVLGGAFTTFNSSPANHIARLSSGGALDSGYNSPLGDTVYSIALQADGKQVVGGGYYLVSGHPYCARLNTDGSLDSTFQYCGLNLNSSVYAVALQTNGQAVIGGMFGGGIMRLSANGTQDSTFNIGSGISTGGAVFGLTVNPANNQVILAGGFSSFNGQTRNSVARLNSDGTLDSYFDPGAGPNNNVLCLVLQSGVRIVIGGAFTQEDGLPRNYLASLRTDKP